MGEQMDTQSVSIDKLYEGMQALESKILDAKSKKDQIIARAKTAKSTQKVNDMLSGLTGKTSMDAFTRMEEKVMALEAAAEASTEQAKGATLLLSGTQQNQGSSNNVEMQFRLLEASDAVEKELEKLKETMVLPEKSSISATKTATTTTTTVKTPSSRHVLLN